MHQLKIAKIISFLLWELVRGIENRGSPLAVACCSVPSAQLTNGSVHNLLGLPCLPITGYNSAAGSRFCSCFWFPLILKKKSLQVNGILVLYWTSQRIRPEQGYELVTPNAIPRDCRALSTGCVEGRRKMNLRKDTMRWKSGVGGWRGGYR